MVKGTVFNIQRFSLHDGPGIRTTVFLKGCPLNCWWCHNPEGIDPRPLPAAEPWKCISCGNCRAICLQGAITVSRAGANINRDRCQRCFKCVEACPSGSLEVIGREYSTAELIRELKKDRMFFEESGGGVTFSGGEPLSQPQFLADALLGLKAEGIHCAVETSGYASWDLFDKIIENTGLFLYDIKLVDDRKSVKYTGAPGFLIRENLLKLLARGCNVQVRVPVIPTVNDDDESLSLIGSFLRESGVKKVELLPYHDLGVHKTQKSGHSYKLSAISILTTEEICNVARFFKKYGLKVEYEVDDHGKCVERD